VPCTEGSPSEAAEYLVLKGAHVLLQAAQLLLQVTCHLLGFSNCCGSCTQAAALDPAAGTAKMKLPMNCMPPDKVDQSTKLVGQVILHCRLHAKIDNAGAIRCIIHKGKTLVNPVCSNLASCLLFMQGTYANAYHCHDMETCML